MKTREIIRRFIKHSQKCVFKRKRKSIYVSKTKQHIEQFQKNLSKRTSHCMIYPIFQIFRRHCVCADRGEIESLRVCCCTSKVLLRTAPQKKSYLETGLRRNANQRPVDSEASPFNINNAILKIFRKKMKLFGAYLPIFLAIGLAIVLLECEAGRRGGGGRKNKLNLTCQLS